MKWQSGPDGLSWSGTIINEDAKREVAGQLAGELRDGDTVGVGSGSTSFLTLQALAARREKEGLSFVGIPTSLEVSWACAALNIPTVSLMERRPDWCFDGADEVDDRHRLIKGRGGALYREKMLMAASPRTYIVVDHTKRVQRLGENYPVPVEVDPSALRLVYDEIMHIPGLQTATVRMGGGKDGPTITEHANILLDLRFSEIQDDVHARLKAIPGVVETGLFIGYQIKLIMSR